MEKIFKHKRILITGHTGFKGAWLTQILLNLDAKVIGISLPPETKTNLFTILNQKNKIKNYFSDIRDYKKIKKIFEKEKPEIIFHLAAQPIVLESYEDPIKTYSTNTLGTANILQIIKETPSVKSGVIITTDKVYENKNLNLSFKETDPLGGHDPYSASKAAADIIAGSYIKSFFNKKGYPLIAIARAGNVIGGGDWAKYRLIPDIIRSVYEKNKSITIRNPKAIRPWEHVLEPLIGYMTLAKGLYQKNSDFIGAWNFGPEDESFVSVEKLTRSILKILGQGKIKIKHGKTKYEAKTLKLSIVKAKNYLGWKPRLNFMQNIEMTADWYKNFYGRKVDPIEFTNNQIIKFLNLK